MDYKLIIGDCIKSMQCMPEKSVQTCVTSPPYFGLRDYGTAQWIGGDPNCDHKGDTFKRHAISDSQEKPKEFFKQQCRKCGAKRKDKQIGLEQTPEEFVNKLVEVFREVRRVLKDDGTLWLNLGDSYVGTGAKGEHDDPKYPQLNQSQKITPVNQKIEGLKRKDLIGIPWRVAFALQSDGWYLRQDIIWSKPNPMPEPVKDRCTKSHEYIFLLSKSPKYYYDHEAIKEDCSESNIQDFMRRKTLNNKGKGSGTYEEARPDLARSRSDYMPSGFKRNKRSVWEVTPKPYSGAHFAVYPPELIEPCILAATKKGDTVLDPFGGSGTTAGVALKNKRKAILCELNPEYASIVDDRIKDIFPDINQYNLLDILED